MGTWTSVSHDEWQNACFAFEIGQPDDAAEMKHELSQLAAAFDQDSIAWAVAETEFLAAGPSARP
jgi:hypothetical protein